MICVILSFCVYDQSAAISVYLRANIVVENPVFCSDLGLVNKNFSKPKRVIPFFFLL